jgi:hypothetical protein
MTAFKEIASKPPLAMPQSVSAGLSHKPFYRSKLACFFEHFRIVGKARSLPALPLQWNIRLGWKWLSVISTLAYCSFDFSDKHSLIVDWLQWQTH